MEDENKSELTVTCYKNAENGKLINPFAMANLSDIIHTESYNNHCVQCDIVFEDSVKFERHNLENHGYKKLLTCQICTATFRRQDHLKRHMRSLHSNQKYSYCPVCGKDCKRQDVLLKHIKQKHDDKSAIYKCRECCKEYNSLSELEKHEGMHMLSERHICPHCNTAFKRRDHMLRHVKSQHLNHVVVCPVCGQVYKRRDHVARHVKEKHHMGLLNGKLVKAADVILGI